MHNERRHKGPKRQAVRWHDYVDGIRWVLKLECGHEVLRRKRYRYSGVGERSIDPVPTWAYCKECAHNPPKESEGE